MSGNEREGLMIAQLGRLSMLEPDAARAERHRVRCRGALGERRLSRPRLMEAALVSAFSIGYLSAVVQVVVWLLERR